MLGAEYFLLRRVQDMIFKQPDLYGPPTARSSCTAITLLLLPRGLEASCSNTILSDPRDGAHGSGKQDRPGAPWPLTGATLTGLYWLGANTHRALHSDVGRTAYALELT